MTSERPDFRRGRLYLAHLDKLRPVLILSPDYRNDRASDVIVIPLSTVLRLAPTHVRLRRGEAGVPEPSMLKCEQITTLPREMLRPGPLGGSLSDRRLAKVEQAVLHAIGVPVGY